MDVATRGGSDALGATDENGASSPYARLQRELVLLDLVRVPRGAYGLEPNSEQNKSCARPPRTLSRGRSRRSWLGLELRLFSLGERPSRTKVLVRTMKWA